jgi:hypothetical protein
MNFSNKTNDLTLEQVYDGFTFSEIRAALGECKQNIARPFFDACDMDKVKVLVGHFRGNPVLMVAAFADLSQKKTSARLNPYDGMSYVDVEAKTMVIGDEKIVYCANEGYDHMFETMFPGLSEKGDEDSEVLPEDELEEDEEEEVPFTELSFSNGIVTRSEGKFDPILVYARVAAASVKPAQELSLKHKEARAVVSHSKNPFVISPAFASGVATRVEVKGVNGAGLAAAIADSLQEKRKSKSKADQDDFKIEMQTFQRIVPTITEKRVVKGKLITSKKPVVKVCTTTGPFSLMNGMYNWNRGIPNVGNSFKSLIKQMDELKAPLSLKGQNKFGLAAYLGVSLGASHPMVNHKITLDLAGFKPGMSLLVAATDSNLVQFLRCNYGHKVVGRGMGSYPILSDDCLFGSKFDAIYFPKPITESLGGEPSKVSRAIRARFVESLKIPVHGKLIFMISPVFFFIKALQSFFDISKSAEYVTTLEMASKSTGGRKLETREDVFYPSVELSANVEEHWYPEKILRKRKCLEIVLMD